MHKHLIKYTKSIFVMAKANFDSWMHSPRTWIMLAFVITFCYIVTNSFIHGVEGLGYKLHFGESLFYMLYNGCNITMTSILFLITVSELPRQIGFQYDMLIRSTRIQWLISQLVYCLWMALCMLVLTVFSVSLFIFPTAQHGQGWSETTLIASGSLQGHEALIPAFIRHSFSPQIACLYAMLPMLLFWLAMVFVILLFSLLGVPLVGVMTYGLMLVANVVFLVETFGGFPMPVYFATLSNITSGWPENELVKFAEAMVGYGATILALLTCMFIRVKKTELTFHFEE